MKQSVEAWNAFRRAFQNNALAGFAVDWQLQECVAQAIWVSIMVSLLRLLFSLLAKGSQKETR